MVEKNHTRRDALKGIAASAASVVGARHLVYSANAKLNLRTADNPEEEATACDDRTLTEPNSSWVTTKWHFLHRGAFAYYGTSPRPEDGRWAHVLTVAGRGESGSFFPSWPHNEDKEDADQSPKLAGHGINISEWGDDVTIWTPHEGLSEEEYLGANPAEDDSSTVCVYPEHPTAGTASAREIISLFRTTRLRSS